MATTPPTVSGVREHADKILAKAVEDGRLTPDGEAAKAAALTPTFSAGTAALDPNTGKAIIPKDQGQAPAFTDGHVPLPADKPTGAALGAPAAEPNAAPAVAAPQAAAGAAAAEGVAATAAEEYEEFEFEDPDLGAKFTMRAPKQYAEFARRGYGRRTAYDKAISYLKNADPVFRSMIEDGRVNKLLPLIQRALEDPAYGEYVTSGFQRSTQGLPLVEQAVVEAARAGAAAAAPVIEDINPFVDPEITTLRQRTEAIEREWQAEKAARQEQTQTAQQRDAAMRRNITLMQGAHQDLAASYPGTFRPDLGDQDPAWKAAYKYAQDAGYLNRYDLRAAIVFGGQGWRSLEAERLAATSSPAAAALGQMDAQLVDAATREAAAAARTVAGGAVAQTVAAPIPPKPVPKNPDGSMKTKEEFMGQVLHWEQTYGRLKQA
jgi:hypothetical protein